jgi:very-short-patch-repair endonuclease
MSSLKDFRALPVFVRTSMRSSETGIRGGITPRRRCGTRTDSRMVTTACPTRGSSIPTIRRRDLMVARASSGSRAGSPGASREGARARREPLRQERALLARVGVWAALSPCEGQGQRDRELRGYVDGFDNLLESIGPGEVRTVFAASTYAAMARLRGHARATGRATIVHCWRRLPNVHTVIDETVAAVARAAFDAWPDWYPGVPRSFASGNGTEAALLNQAALRGVLDSRTGVNAAWLRTTAARCAEGRAPLLADFAAAVQARQLSVALSPDGPIVAMVLDSESQGEKTQAPPPPASRLRAFASASAWLAREAGARVVAVLPESLSRHIALDSITYEACHLEGRTAPEVSGGADYPMTTIWPILGRPHPASKGECLLAERLAADPELRGLFHFNRRIVTVRDTTPLVDLVWPDGRVVVEVDGWGHLMQPAFRGDRLRDYELLISGYLVLRLPHDQVLEDLEIAVDKIRDVVHFRRRGSQSAPRTAERAT